MNEQWISGGVEFKKGDLVKIMCNVSDEHPDGMGQGVVWANIWCDRMNEAFGRLFTIDFIDATGVHFEVQDDDPVTWYGYPLRCMENMTVQRLQVHSGDVVSNSVVN